MLENIPIIDADSDDFKEQLAFQIWSTQSSSDYRNDRERPYNGQPWTDQGERGKTEVKGLTMRDIADCIVKAFLLSSCTDDKQAFDYACKTEGRVITPYEKAETGTWRYQDMYEIDLSKISPGAVIQNATCEIEKMMGIFPNIPK